MKIQKTKCEQCGVEHDYTETTIELRNIAGLKIPQIGDNDAPLPDYEIGTKPVVLIIRDFCNRHCLRDWLKNN